MSYCRMTWWTAGGIHAHVSYPDGSWMRRTWRADSWWEIDALIRELQDTYGPENVDVNDRGRRALTRNA